MAIHRCGGCGVPFYRSPSLVLKQTFCSRACWSSPDRTVRFWAKVQKSESCWRWTGAHMPRGYGIMGWSESGKRMQGYAHRYSWEIHFGPIPAGLRVLHHCDNPACVRPDHLFIGTAKDNTADMIAKGRRGYTGLRGETHPKAKLSDTAVRQIRRAAARGVSQRSLADQFGVQPPAIYKILTGRSWQHVS